MGSHSKQHHAALSGHNFLWERIILSWVLPIPSVTQGKPATSPVAYQGPIARRLQDGNLCTVISPSSIWLKRKNTTQSMISTHLHVIYKQNSWSTFNAEKMPVLRSRAKSRCRSTRYARTFATSTLHGGFIVTSWFLISDLLMLTTIDCRYFFCCHTLEKGWNRISWRYLHPLQPFASRSAIKELTAQIK